MIKNLKLGYLQHKLFVIGFNKTGTTSLASFLKDHNFKINNQPKAENLLKNYIKRDFRPIRKFCLSYNAFQDIPFSLPYLYIYLDQAFPNSKFILTTRDSSEQWYNSLVKFHAKMFSCESIATAHELKNANYRYQGFIYQFMKEVFNTHDDCIYEKDLLTKTYEKHNFDAENYFKNKSNFIKVNLSNNYDFDLLCNFLQLKPNYKSFPWKNKT